MISIFFSNAYNFLSKFFLGCPLDPDDKTKRWCSTKVDSNGNHVLKQNEYGHCSKNCPIQNNGNSNGGQQQYPPNNQGN